MKPCPHCDDEWAGFLVLAPMRGTSVLFYDERGKYQEQDLDRTYSLPGKTIRCAGCEKIRRDVVLGEKGIVEK